MFDSFNEFVKPISNQAKLPQNLPFGFRVVHNITVSKIFGNTARFDIRRDAIVLEVHYSSLLRFQIIIFYRLSCLSNFRFSFLSSI